MRRAIYVLMIAFMMTTLFTTQAFGHEITSPPALISESAIVIESKTGKILYEKDSDTKMYPASLTKMATAIYAIEKGNLNDTVTVSEKARHTEGTRVYLEEGEKVPLKKLIQGLLINSGNDAGMAIAEHLSGSVDQFAIDLNRYLEKEIGVKDTNFENPHGLFDPEHVTTAADLAKITQYAMKNKSFRDIFGTEELKWKGDSWDTTLITHHKLMREIPYEGITGGKTGFVNESGFTLAATAEREHLSLIVVTLNSYLKSGSYDDTIHLLDYAFESFETSSIPKGTTFEFGNEEYKTDRTLYYTHSRGEKIKQAFKDGTLKIMGATGNVIATFPVDRVEQVSVGKNAKQESLNEANQQPLFNNLLTKSVAVLFGLLFIFIGYIVTRKYLDFNK